MAPFTGEFSEGRLGFPCSRGKCLKDKGGAFYPRIVSSKPRWARDAVGSVCPW